MVMPSVSKRICPGTGQLCAHACPEMAEVPIVVRRNGVTLCDALGSPDTREKLAALAATFRTIGQRALPALADELFPGWEDIEIHVDCLVVGHRLMIYNEAGTFPQFWSMNLKTKRVQRLDE